MNKKKRYFDIFDKKMQDRKTVSMENQKRRLKKNLYFLLQKI